MIIKNQDSLEKFCASVSGARFVTIDTEFLREKTYYPKLCLIQIGDPGGNAVAIDPLEGDLDLEPVYKILFDKNILKVFHAGRQDLEIFYQLTGKIVDPFFDTQIAAMVCGYGDSVGYESLVRNITNQRIDKSVQFTNWSKRPLSERQIHYALGDVTYLVDVYKHLDAELEKQGRTSWVFEEEEALADRELYENPPDLAWKRIKTKSLRPKNMAVLREVAAWREQQAQKKDIPRTWVLRDDTLVDMAGQMPETAQQLSKIRNMSEDFAKGDKGKTLLSLIEKAKNSDKKTWPPFKKKRPLPAHAAATVDVLKLLLKVQCAHFGVATKLVAGKEDLEILALKDNPDTPVVKGWRYEIFGKEALELKKGRLAMGLKDGKVVKYKVSSTTDYND